MILPSDALAGQTWVAGAYAVRRRSPAASGKLGSGVIPLAVAPRVTSITPNPAARDVNGDVVLTVACTPRVSPKQPAVLVFADRGVAAGPARVAATDPLTFAVSGAGPDQGGRPSPRGRRRKPAFRPVGQPASLRL